MRFTILFIVAVLVASLPTCKKNTPPIVDIPDDPIDTLVPPVVDSHIIELGKVAVLKNGAIWDAPFKAGFSQTGSSFAISGSRTNYSNGVGETFSLRDIPCKSGKYRLEFWPSIESLYPNQTPQAVFVMMYDGDQPIGDFVLDTLRIDHYIQILEFDTVSNIVEGRFQIFTKKDETTGSWHPQGIVVPDSIAMTEGKFRLQVKHY